MSEIAYIPSPVAEVLSAKLWALSDPSPTRGTTALFEVEKALDLSTWLVVPVGASIPLHEAADMDGIAEILQPLVGHGIEQADIDRLEQMVVANRGRRLAVYEAFPPIFKLKDAANPNGLGRTREQLVEEGKLDTPNYIP